MTDIDKFKLIFYVGWMIVALLGIVIGSILIVNVVEYWIQEYELNSRKVCVYEKDGFCVRKTIFSQWIKPIVKIDRSIKFDTLEENEKVFVIAEYDLTHTHNVRLYKVRDRSGIVGYTLADNIVIYG